MLAAGALAAGCGGSGGTGSASSSVPSDTVGVKATEMKFGLTTDTAPAGDLPEIAGKRDETGAIGAIGAKQLQPGASASLTRTMKAGHYALVCALPGHYEAGMYSDFTVG